MTEVKVMDAQRFFLENLLQYSNYLREVKYQLGSDCFGLSCHL